MTFINWLSIMYLLGNYIVMEAFSVKLLEFLSGFSGPMAYALILGILFICGLGVPIPEDITLIGAGLLAGLGKISLVGALLTGFIGVLIGDAILFFIGRTLGDRVFTFPVFRKIFTPSRISVAKAKVLENSKFICFTARFLPGLRSPIYLTAGVLGVKPLVFFALDGFAALISVPIWVVGAYWFGQNLDEALAFAKQAQLYLIGSLVIIFVSYYIYKKQKSK